MNIHLHYSCLNENTNTMKSTFINSSFYLVMALVLVISLSIGCKKDKDKDDDNNNGIKLETGTVKDIEGNTYKTVKICDQWWMAENLKTTKYNDGSKILFCDDWLLWSTLNKPAYSWYDFQKYGDKYGAQYNWYAVETGKLCPEGWHVPTDEEWQIMEVHIGLSPGEAQNQSFRGSKGEGGKLKETGTEHWKSPNTGATNETGFTGLPGGYRSSYSSAIGKVGYWWTSTLHPSTQNYAWMRGLYAGDSRINRFYYPALAGYSVRCIED